MQFLPRSFPEEAERGGEGERWVQRGQRALLPDPAGAARVDGAAEGEGADVGGGDAAHAGDNGGGDTVPRGLLL